MIIIPLTIIMILLYLAYNNHRFRLKNLKDKQEQYQQELQQHQKFIATVDTTKLTPPPEVYASWSPEYQAYVNGMLQEFTSRCDRFKQ